MRYVHDQKLAVNPSKGSSIPFYIITIRSTKTTIYSMDWHPKPDNSDIIHLFVGVFPGQECFRKGSILR
jgi:hypothetical protein